MKHILEYNNYLIKESSIYNISYFDFRNEYNNFLSRNLKKKLNDRCMTFFVFLFVLNLAKKNKKQTKNKFANDISKDAYIYSTVIEICCCILCLTLFYPELLSVFFSVVFINVKFNFF